MFVQVIGCSGGRISWGSQLLDNLVNSGQLLSPDSCTFADQEGVLPIFDTPWNPLMDEIQMGVSETNFPAPNAGFLTPNTEKPHFTEPLAGSSNHVDIIGLLALCAGENNLHLGSSLHASLIKSCIFYVVNGDDNHRHTLLVWNSLLTLYAKCGKISDAAMLFDEMPVRDTVSWNIMISGYLRYLDFDVGLGVFKGLHESGDYRLDHATLTTLLSACDCSYLGCYTELIHGLVFLSGYEHEITVGNALTTSYFKCGLCYSGRRVFDEMMDRNVVTWTAAISGLAQNRLFSDAFELFVEMHHGLVHPNLLTYLSSLAACSGLQALKEGCQVHGLICKLGLASDICVESALMDMYSKCGMVTNALKIFESAEELDAVSMTVILVGFAQNGMEEEAIQIFVKMVKAGIEIDTNVVSAVLGVFGVDTSLVFGKEIHALSIKRSFINNPFVGNGLVSMYAKCGDLKDSEKIFDEMPVKNSISWNSMIAAFARHGDGAAALELFEVMELEGVEPTDVTFLSLLHACSHVGLVERGMEFLHTMNKKHGICPRSEHFACVVDMLGRAGLLNEARKLIEELPEKPGILVWQALLGACSFHGDSELGRYAADQLLAVAPESAAPYVLMANIYSSEKKWRERATTIKKMKEMGLAKETGISWLEIDKEVHSFVVGDIRHSEAGITYETLAQLLKHMRDEGYVPDKRFILFYQDEVNTRELKSLSQAVLA